LQKLVSDYCSDFSSQIVVVYLGGEIVINRSNS
jgi:hypothetical protein